MAHNSIGNEGLEVLAESLSTNRHLTFLSLYDNPSITSAKSLAKLIETNTAITYLSAWGLNIGRDGVLLLLEALKKNTHLITLVLDEKDKETCQSSSLYEDVKHRIITKNSAMFDKHKEQVHMTPSEQKEQCDEKATNERILIKFHKRWEMITVSRFDDALKHYFEEFYDGCYKDFDSTTFITLSIARSQADNFIKAVRNRRDALKRIGILEIAIGRKNISAGEADINFNISLCESVKVGDSFEVSMLLQLGADPNSKDERGKSAVEIANEGGHIQIKEMLLTAGGKLIIMYTVLNVYKN